MSSSLDDPASLRRGVVDSRTYKAPVSGKLPAVLTAVRVDLCRKDNVSVCVCVRERERETYIIDLH